MGSMIRQSRTGKIHLSGGINATNCSSGNKGLQTVARLTPKMALTFPRDAFCKHCFGDLPYSMIARLERESDAELQRREKKSD